MSDNTPESETTRALREARTQYNTVKTAEEAVVWSIDPQNENIDDRTPQEATRVWTIAIRDGSNDVDLNYMEAEIDEGH